jgi:hypothetical protein
MRLDQRRQSTGDEDLLGVPLQQRIEDVHG